MQRIVIASGNAHKIRELQELFNAGGLGNIELVAMTDLVGSIEIDETGLTFEENAYIKAVTVHQLTGLPVLADDSGLCVDALHGAPGVRSARYAGTGASDGDNRKALRSAMQDAGVEISGGRFVCVLWYIDSLRSFGIEGIVEGTVRTEELGDTGFGYDSMFTPEGAELTYGQVSSVEKARTSHRSRASADMILRLAELYHPEPPRRSDPAVLSIDDLCRASIAALKQNAPLLRSIAEGVGDHVQARRLKEALLQVYLFAGFPAALDALVVVAEVLTAKGLSTADAFEAYDVANFERRGEDLCRAIYGSVYDRMMSRFESISPSMRSWMIIEGYGKTLSREGLDSRERELCIVCMLAALERPSQLYSHVRGSMAMGATHDDLESCCDLVADLCGRESSEMLRSTVSALRMRG